MTSAPSERRNVLPDQTEERDHDGPCWADAGPAPSDAPDRVERLRVAILQNRDLAKKCDFNFRTQLLALANEMESYLRSLVSPPSEREWE